MVSLQALVVPSDTTASAKKGAASDPAAAASDESQFLLQQGADTTDCAASYAADDWDWQQSQSQANLGFQDAFEASQGLGATPNLSPAITWAAPKPAVQTASVSGLPVRAVRQPQVQEKPSTAKHVPFSNRRLALPTSKPEMKQRPGVTVQQLNPEFLSVRRPLPKQHSALPPQGTALVKASASSQGAGAFSDADLLGSWPPQAASASIKLRSPMPAVHTQAMSVCASRLEPAGLNCSLKHDATAAATDRAVPGPVTNVTRGTGPGVPAHLVSDVHTLETAKLQPQRACAQVAKSSASVTVPLPQQVEKRRCQVSPQLQQPVAAVHLQLGPQLRPHLQQQPSLGLTSPELSAVSPTQRRSCAYGWHLGSQSRQLLQALYLR